MALRNELGFLGQWGMQLVMIEWNERIMSKKCAVFCVKLSACFGARVCVSEWRRALSFLCSSFC